MSDSSRSPDREELPELLDRLISKSIVRGRDGSSTQGRLIYGSYESRQKEVDAARLKVEEFVARLESENERLKETALTRADVQLLRDAANVFNPDLSSTRDDLENLADRIDEKLRRSATSEETSP